MKEEWQAMGMMPYAYNDDGEWVCFENEASLAKKVRYNVFLMFNEKHSLVIWYQIDRVCDFQRDGRCIDQLNRHGRF